jgi:phosphoribosylaminoimidazole-succinocarboxamide synthase
MHPDSSACSAATSPSAVFTTRLSLPGRRQGKVRDVYRTAADPAAPLLIVATDRLSAFDVVMPTPVPGKGRLLTTMSLGWFGFLRGRGIVADHVIDTDLSAIPGLTDAERAMLAGRSMRCRPAKVVAIECVARGYLAGSGWNEYREHGTVCGIPLAPGLTQCARLHEPIFTPATKAEEGHDENISFSRACDLVGIDLMTRLRDLTIAIYMAAADHALERGVILADTKFEFGFALGPDGTPTGELILVDEVLTPDSSRYWPAEDYAPGRDQQSYDKQFVRNHLLGLVAQGKWNKEAPGPELPADVVEATAQRYEEALARLALPLWSDASDASDARRGGAR